MQVFHFTNKYPSEVNMASEEVKSFFDQKGLLDRVREFKVSSATVDLAAEALGVIPARIAKTLSFYGEEGAILLVAAGDAKVDSRKFKDAFMIKSKMLKQEDVVKYTGHPVGGVCPFLLPQGTRVFLDLSLKRFESVFPACGSDRSSVELNPNELYRLSKAEGWVDVCKCWAEEADISSVF